MDSDEVLRLKQINGLLELFADRRYSEAGRSNNQSALRRSAAASSVDSCFAKQRRISLCGKGSAQKTDNGIAATPTSLVSHWQN